MRTVIPFNQKWAFSKEADSLPETMPDRWVWVDLPHTWNGIDGQDGGNDYYRGACWYAHELLKADLPGEDEIWLELLGANSSAEVYLNGKKLQSHDGGYSTWRVELTKHLREKNLLVIRVDNSPNDRVYPQQADFTFYGGLYRGVNLIAVPNAHFTLDHWGGPGIKVTPEVSGAAARVKAEAFLSGDIAGKTVVFSLYDREGKELERQETGADQPSVTFLLENAHLWQGRKDPYLYSMTVRLLEGEKELDSVSARFGCRAYVIDPEKGFFLNGESYPLRGVSRHQDRPKIGNALLPEHHREDMDLICELGATTIRLAHYQHDQYFYDLCDERGLVVWAEIPYISSHMPNGRENTLNQMRELIVQNYNHPSIVVWGLSNEITMGGEPNEDLLENHRLLNNLAHQLDPTRKTVMACLSTCDPDWELVKLPDVLSYNHYFGWYGGDVSMYGPWLDDFHRKFPQTPIGISEYGCEALNWHTSHPEAGDYTEEYQAYYHQETIKQLFTRPYLWATHVWNMFDFAADARAEGGENGMNHKGLVTFDRKYKKDSFYAYKAWLSEEPFVHICGKRYVDRTEDVTQVTIYSNQPQVELFADGKSLGVQESDEHFFTFEVPNAGETSLTAKAGDCKDYSLIRKVEQFNESYRMKEHGAVLNWFDVVAPEGYFSLNDHVEDIRESERGAALMKDLLDQLLADKGGADGSLSEMVNGFTVRRIMNMAGTMGAGMTKEEMLDWNRKLNRIPRP